MISVTWMIDVDRNTEYLECRNETPHFIDATLCQDEIDIVKVYFNTMFDIDTAKGLKLEIPIAKAIFSNREKYGSVLNGWLEIMPHTIFFETSTDVPVYTETIIKELHRE